MSARHESILGTIGRTPVVRLRKLAPPQVRLYAKLESFNPGGSVKDRLALGVIEDAERRGRLRPGQTVIEATSGNTGIGLALVCAQKGYPLVVTMAESFSVERRKLMRFLGAKVVLTPAAEKGIGMLAKAVELAEANDWFLCRQFDNEANADFHSATTAREILEDFEGERLDYWVTGFGTGGTLKGVARVLKAERPETKVVACEPDNSPVLGSGIAQERAVDGTPLASHPTFRPHPMQGWSPDFIAKLTEDALRAGLIDRILQINGAEAFRSSRALACEEGILAGTSGGATLAGALKLCEGAPDGTTILCMLPDTGERYLSTPLFEDIPEGMTDDELALSRSTPSCRFEAAQAPSPVAKPAASLPTAFDEASLSEAKVLVERTIGDSRHPVAMFALEWCEFCWSVRRFFAHLGVEFRSIDLDSVAYQGNDLGGRIRAVLRARTGSPTIPQIFVGGEHIGGCSEIFAAYGEGRLQKMLTASGVSFDASATLNAEDFLPKWVQPRSAA